MPTIQAQLPMNPGAPLPRARALAAVRGAGWLRSPVVLATAYVGAWALFCLLNAFQNHLAMSGKNAAWPFTESLRSAYTEWGAWALLLPLIVVTTRALRPANVGWVGSILAHLAAVPLFTVGQVATHVAIDIPVEAWLHRRFDLVGHFWMLLPKAATGNVFTLAVLVGAVHALELYRSTRRQQLRESQLEARLTEARLQVLQMQLQPHFLFNALNAISALMHRDVAAADRMVARLAELLRISLDTAGRQEVSLGEELASLQPYLDIEQARFEDRLTVTVDVPPELGDAQVPVLVLQPLVENAIRHGIAPRNAAGAVVIRARRDADVLRLSVADDGRGPPAGGIEAIQPGVGLTNTRARLEQLYGARQRLELAAGDAGGFVVRVELPYRTGGGPWTSSVP